MDERGVLWAVSNSDTAFVRKLFAGYRTVEVVNRREINLNSQERDITELLITNYPDPQRSYSLFPDAEDHD
jgi:DNA adenine methylase